MGADSLVLWSHALAALLCGGLALAVLREPAAELPRLPLVAALALTALWALAVAGIDARDVAARVADAARQVAYFALLYALLARENARPGLAVASVFAIVVLVCGAGGAIAVAETLLGAELGNARVVLRMIAAVTGLVLVHHVALGGSRGSARPLLAGLAGLWSVEFAAAVAVWLGAGASAGPVLARGLAAIVLAALVALAWHRPAGSGALRPSRAVAVRSLSLAAVVGYVVVMVLATGLLADFGSGSRAIRTALVAGGTATLIGLVASPRVRAFVKVKVAKHLFDHRYDYRREWLRFTATLGRPGADAPPLAQRLVKAIADLTDSPGGLLLVATDDGLEPAGAWNWQGDGTVAGALAAQLAASDRIVDLDAARGDVAAELPEWLAGHDAAWAIVPLVHLGRLTGAVVLARPPFARALDWEDYDLLRVAGAQGASYLAEGHAAAALAEAQRFEEFNRRFAFIVHDVKNLVSQLTLVARNAERHADKPAFRADMIATLKDSCDRMAALLQRLSQHSGARADPPQPVELAAFAARVARRRRGQHAVSVEGGPAWALADPVRLDTILAHLIQNAIEASAPDAPIGLTVATDGGVASLAVVDHGRGMTPAFVRDELFRPFASSKPGGFGIGAFEVRQLAQAMGGSVAVASTPGGGTRFTVSLPAAPALDIAA